MASKCHCQWCDLLCAVCRIVCFRCCQKCCGKESAQPRPEYSVIALGLSGAGKSFLLAKLSGETTDDIQQTTGFSVKVVQLEEAILNVKELGGGESIRKYWQHYYEGAEGLIFIVDCSSTEDDLDLAVSELQGALSHPSLDKIPLLLLANKQDMENCKSSEEITKIFKLEVIARNREWLVHSFSIQNVDDAQVGLQKFAALLATKEQHNEENRI